MQDYYYRELEVSSEIYSLVIPINDYKKKNLKEINIEHKGIDIINLKSGKI